MTHESTYDTIDWSAEAARLVAAFGLEGEHKFEKDEESGYMQLRSDSPELWLLVPAHRDIKLTFSYCHMWRMMRVQNPKDWSAILIPWNGNEAAPQGYTMPASYPLFIARGLFVLGLLTPQVEELMGFTITAHEKMEWTREYKSKNDL